MTKNVTRTFTVVIAVIAVIAVLIFSVMVLAAHRTTGHTAETGSRSAIVVPDGDGAPSNSADFGDLLVPQK